MATGKLVICNTTPIINFAEIGRLEVLERLFGRIVLPRAVVQELTAKQRLFPKAALAPQAACFDLATQAPLQIVRSLATWVHPGEAECLALASQHAGALLILDDVAARELALVQGFRVIGTLGCLILAKQQGIIHALAPLIEDLRTHARFWIADPLRIHILRQAGEMP